MRLWEVVSKCIILVLVLVSGCMRKQVCTLVRRFRVLQAKEWKG